MAQPLSFRDVLVTPTAGVLGRPGPFEFKGGPLWPDFAAQREARHCRGRDAQPFDTEPDAAEATEQLPEAAWCGPACHHFGHQVADFGMRIALSAHRLPGMPLLFCGTPEVPDPPFLPGILAAFGVDPARVVVARAPLRVGRLHVFPQAERLNGPPPEGRYLDLLDRIALPPDPELAGATVFLSRSRIRTDTLMGRIAGEAYLDEALREAGVLVAYPEELPVAEQLRLYRSAGLLLFSEGSALHGLQLLGRIRGEVAVLLRRPGSRMAAGALPRRTKRLHWIEASAGLVRGRRRDGVGFDVSRGITLLDEAVLRARLGEVLGLDLAWDSARFRAAAEADLRRWVEVRRVFAARQGYPADDGAVVAECLHALGVAA